MLQDNCPRAVAIPRRMRTSGVRDPDVPCYTYSPLRTPDLILILFVVFPHRLKAACGQGAFALVALEALLRNQVELDEAPRAVVDARVRLFSLHCFLLLFLNTPFKKRVDCGERLALTLLPLLPRQPSGVERGIRQLAFFVHDFSVAPTGRTPGIVAGPKHRVGDRTARHALRKHLTVSA